MKNKRLYFIAVLFLIGLGFIFISFFSIYFGVKKACVEAKKEYQNSCVESLIKVIQSDKSTFRQKNTAVWALGQLADKKALSFLKSLEKSIPKQEKCRYQQYLCQYEIAKAIKWMEKGNLTSFMYINQKRW